MFSHAWGSVHIQQDRAKLFAEGSVRSISEIEHRLLSWLSWRGICISTADQKESRQSCSDNDGLPHVATMH